MEASGATATAEEAPTSDIFDPAESKSQGNFGGETQLVAANPVPPPAPTMSVGTTQESESGDDSSTTQSVRSDADGEAKELRRKFLADKFETLTPGKGGFPRRGG